MFSVKFTEKCAFEIFSVFLLKFCRIKYMVLSNFAVKVQEK